MVLNNSQSKILEILRQEDTVTYTELANMAGLSYDGVRGRISELSQKGYEIQKVREDGNTYLKLNSKPNKTPLRPVEKAVKRLQGVEDFHGMQEFLTKIRTAKVNKVKKLHKSNDNYAVLALSDLHFGEIIYDQTNGDLLYNTAKAFERMEALTSTTIEKLINSKINHITIALIGDVIDGDMIYKNHMFMIEKPAIKQVKDAVKSLTKMIKSFTAVGITVEVHAVRGNHGITNYKNLEEDNWDNSVYDMLDTIFIDDKNVKINNTSMSEVKFKVGNRQVVLNHGSDFGDQIKTASGLRNFRGLCAKHKLNAGDVVIIGHLHTFGVEYDQGKMLVRNGSLADASEYAFKLNLWSEPEQTLLFFDEYNDYPTIYPLNVR